MTCTIVLPLLLSSIVSLGNGASAGAPSASDPFAFDLLEPAPVDPEAQQVAHAVQRRRRMLQSHQIAGLSTLALMASTVILGQLNYHDLYTSGGDHAGRYTLPHRILAYATTGGFVATASLSLFAPEPFAKVSRGWDSATVHKAAVALASAGMVTQIGLGFVTARQANAGNGRRLPGMMQAHQVVGYTTLACLTTAALVWVF